MISKKIILAGHAIAKTDKITLAHDMLAEFLKLNTAEVGCELCTLHINTKNNNHFMVYEIWKDKEAWLKHRNLNHVEDFLASYQNLFEEMYFTTYHNVHDDGVYKYGSLTSFSKKIAVLAYATAHAGKIDAAKKSLALFLQKNRQEPGCMYSSLQIEHDNPNQFMVYEVWENQEAFFKHLSQEHCSEMSVIHKEFMDNVKLDTFSCHHIELHGLMA